MAVITVSKPTQQQFVHGVERTAFVFVLAVATYLKTTSDPFSKAALTAAGYAGVTAVYQALLSIFTTL